MLNFPVPSQEGFRHGNQYVGYGTGKTLKMVNSLKKKVI